jgi:hypothetical protein
MGDEAVARVRQHFTWSEVARSTFEVYEAVVAGRSPAGRSPGTWAVSA